MKHNLRTRLLSLLLCVSMMVSLLAHVTPVHSAENDTEGEEKKTTISDLTAPFRPDVEFVINGETLKSQSYRIPTMVTLDDGTIVAAADIRWNTTYDGGGLDTLVARSTDGGKSWKYTVANYLGDNGNTYNSQSTAFIDSCLTVAEDGKTVYLLCDLYPYGIALNGNGSQKTPATDVGFTEDGYLKLSNNDHSSYDFYLKAGCIYNSSNVQVAGYHVDEYFNLFNKSNEKVSNLFFADSPYKVARTGFLYLISSTDGGTNWSAPELLNLKTSSEQVCLVAPGNGITTSDGTMVFPVYSHNGTGNQQLGFVYSEYSENGVVWKRSTNFTGATWSSESAVVEVGKGTLRFFYRNGTSNLCYVDYDMNTSTWGSCVGTGVKTNSNTQLSAITYSKTFNGQQVILVSCPTGPNEAGSDNNDGSYRTNGKIFVGVVATDGKMSWPQSIDVSPAKATGQLSGFPYTENQGFFAYSCLTERSDGSIAILYENNQFDWGASGNNGDGTYNPGNVTTYYTITAKTYDWFELLYGNVSEELMAACEKLMDTDLIAEFEAVYATISASDIAALKESALWDVIAEHKSLLVYDHFYSTVSEAEFNAVKEKYSQEYDYIQNDPELKYFNDLILEQVRYLDQHPEKRYVELGEIEYVELPSYTNVAPLAKPTVNPLLRRSASSSTFALRNTALTAANDADNGVVLDKNVTKNADGTYTVRLEAYTTGQTVTTVTETEMPADIILVLDLSNSMTSSMDKVGYQKITDATATQGYQYAQQEKLFVKIGEEYREVSVTGTDPQTTKPPQYTGSRTAAILYSNRGSLYYEYEEGMYAKVTVERSGGNSGNRNYTIYYTVNRTKYYIADKVSGTAEIDAFTFYTDNEEVTVYGQYEYSYRNENNETVKITYNTNDSIIGGSNPEYYTTVSGSTTRAQALKDAVTAFSEQVAEKAKGKDGISDTEDDVAHAIAIIGYNNPANTSTGIYIGDTVHGAGTAAAGVYGTALQDMSTTDGVNNITASIGALKNQQGTYTYSGTEMANGILNAQPESRYMNEKGETIRSKVVVIFTDGDPSNDNYDAPILDTYEMKNTHKATVYTVGILDGGNATISPDGSIDKGDINKFMHYMSSNYQYAQSMTNPGALTNTNHATAGSYYLLASSADDLNNIFGSISSSATSGGSITDLSTSTQIRDIISPYFQLPEKADVDAIKLSYADYVGENTWGKDAPLAGATPTISDDRKVIGVTGFDYKENWVGTATDADGKVTYHGKKLIIEFPIVVDPEFLGGSDVVTNGDLSGIYESADATTPIEKFEVPDVDVDLAKISTVVQNKNVYLGNTVDLTSILNLYVKRNDSNENLQITVDGINNAYVDLTYTITLNNETVAVYTISAGETWAEGAWTVNKGNLLQNYLASDDTPFEVTCVMTDAAESSELNPSYTEADGTATVFVYKPTVTFKDVTKTPMQDYVNYKGENLVEGSVVWKHGDTLSTSTAMEGEMPELTYTYKADSGCVDTNSLVITYEVFYVNVTEVWSNGNNIIAGVTFNHKDCSDHCGFESNKGEFMIHLTQVFTSLVIQKEGWENVDPNQSFIFNVVELGENGAPIENSTVTVTVHENGTITIDGLLVNRSYKVTEETTWSWRYEFSNWEFESSDVGLAKNGNENGAIVTLGFARNVITFENERSVIWWLDGDSWCNNIFKNPNE